MKNLVIFAQLSFIVLFFTQCMSLPKIASVNIRPLNLGDIFYQKGNGFLVQKKDSISIYTSFVNNYSNGNYVEFIVNIENNSNDTLFFDPMTTRLYFLSEKNDSFHFSPLNPEEAIGYYHMLLDVNEREYHSNQKSIASSVKMQGISSSLNAIGGIIDLFGKKDKESEERAKRRQIESQEAEIRQNRLQNQRTAEILEYQQQKQNLEKAIDVWQNKSMRKNHILPYQSIEGSIFFPKYPQNGTINLVFNVDKKVFDFPFLQRVSFY